MPFVLWNSPLESVFVVFATYMYHLGNNSESFFRVSNLIFVRNISRCCPICPFKALKMKQRSFKLSVTLRVFLDKSDINKGDKIGRTPLVSKEENIIDDCS